MTAEIVADALLAPLSATLIEYQRHERGATYTSIKAGIDDLLGWILAKERAEHGAGP